MPTIDQLPAAAAAADTDEVLVSQAGVTRRATRAQLVASAQPQIVLAAGELLGRVSAGSGGPEAITLGGNLTLANGTLSATSTPYSIGGLPAGRVPAGTDLVALAQGGSDGAIGYAQFMGGLATLPGVDASIMTVTGRGGTTARLLADSLGDALPVEAFGAAGDGVTDDSAALAAAAASGKPVRLGARTYVVNGQWTIAASLVLLGVPGATVLRRMKQVGTGPWISIQGASFVAEGVTFDANSAAVAQDGWGVLVTAACSAAEFADCCFANTAGATLGCGLAFLTSDPAASRHVVRDCEMTRNGAHGVWVQAVDGVQISDCRAHDNGGYGLCVDFTDPTLVAKLRLTQIVGNRCWNNQRGISLGNYNATNAQPPVWGNANPDAIGALIASNECHDNAVYGIAVSGQGIAVQGNLLSDNGSVANGGAGILANCASSRICGNLVTGSGQYGIDAGGSIDTDIGGNHVTGSAVGLNVGGSQRLRVCGNFVQQCGWAVTAYNVETDGHGNNFGIAAQAITLDGNWITLSGSSEGGVYLVDAPQGISVCRNSFVGTNGAVESQALWAHTDAAVISGNSWNNQQRFICNPSTDGALQQVLFPDIADDVMITAAPSGVQSMLPQHAAAVQDQIGFIKVTAGGSGYTHASVAISGSGSGATAIAYVSAGAVIGIALTSPGVGYAAGGTASVVITGDGTGAAATAQVGLPVLEERRLRVACNCAVHFSRVGSVPFQDNWTLFDLTIPAEATVEWVGTWGGWRAVQFPGSDYLAPTGDGGLVMRTAANGDLTLRPAGSGRVRIGRDADPWGYIACIGHGSPVGVVVAPPGSDYRNLDGGAGSTLWIKQSGQDASGWYAIA